MMSPEVIRSISAEAARKAARAHRRPLVIESDDLLLDDAKLVGFLGKMPFLGDYLPAGWELMDMREVEALDPKARCYKTLFVDGSGWGDIAEPALTREEFAKAVRALGPGHGFGLADMGQFQANVWVYREVARG